jgi:hypothetical protein
LRFAARLNVNSIPDLVARFRGILGDPPWQKRASSLRARLRSNPLLQPVMRRYHMIELRMGEVLTDNATDIDVRKIDDYRLLSFIAPVVQIYEAINDTGKTRIAGALRDGLNTDRGLLPFLEGRAGFDFLATRDGAELEVECKSVSGDLGRKIHKRQMAELANRIDSGIDRDELQATALKAIDDVIGPARNRHFVVATRSNHAAVIVSLESALEDRMLAELMRDLKQSARDQFTKTRPGALVVYFLDLEADDLEEVAALQTSTELQAPRVPIARADHERTSTR